MGHAPAGLPGRSCSVGRTGQLCEPSARGGDDVRWPRVRPGGHAPFARGVRPGRRRAPGGELSERRRGGGDSPLSAPVGVSVQPPPAGRERRTFAVRQGRSRRPSTPSSWPGPAISSSRSIGSASARAPGAFASTSIRPRSRRPPRRSRSRWARSIREQSVPARVAQGTLTWPSSNASRAAISSR